MKLSQQKYQEMLQEPVVPTHLFHEVFALLLADGNTHAIEYMEALLNPPRIGPIRWELRGIELMRQKMIATVTEGEALAAIVGQEDAPEWDVIAQRVVEARKASYNKGP